MNNVTTTQGKSMNLSLSALRPCFVVQVATVCCCLCLAGGMKEDVVQKEVNEALKQLFTPQPTDTTDGKLNNCFLFVCVI
jgi:hypothetical protein